MKKSNLLKLVIAMTIIFIASCEPEKYVINLPSPNNDTTLVYYILDTSSVINYNINEYHISLEGDCNVVGIFLDRDTNNFFTDKIDFEIGQITVCPEEVIPEISVNEYLDDFGCTVWQLIVNGEIFSEKTMCPDTVSIILPRDTIFLQGYSYVREYYYEGFNNPGNTSYYKSIGWTGKGFNVDQAIYTYPEVNFDTLWSPQIFSEPMSIDYIDIYIGSQNSYSVSILLEDIYGNISVVNTFNTFASSFSRDNLSSYNHISYYCPVKDLEFDEIVKVGIAKEGIFHPQNKNQKVNVDELFVRGVKIVD